MESRRISRVLLGLSVSVIWTGGCNQTHPATQPVAVQAPVRAPDAPEVPTILDQRIDSIAFQETPLADAIKTLREKTGQNIFVNWKVLEAAGVKRETSVSARLRDVKLGAALRTILADAAGGRAKLGVALDDGVVTVTTVAELGRNVVTRVYDIRDLIVNVPDFESGPNGVQPTTQPSREKNVDAIQKLISETIDADNWNPSDPGITPNRMRELSGQLIVTAMPDTQKQIIALLDQLRENRAVQITLEARFISVDLDRLPQPLAKSLRQTFERDKANDVKIALLSPEQTDELIRHAGKLRDTTLLTAPRITLFNGQRAFVNVSTSQAYVAGMTVIKSETHDQSYEPQIQTVSTGVQLDACATASANRKSVTVTIKPTLSKLLAMKTVQYKDVKDLNVQVPIVATQSLSTTVSIPDRQTCVVGGLVDRDVVVEGKPGTVSRPIFLLVKPSLIVQREVAAR